jgi:hypothetical protein
VFDDEIDRVHAAVEQLTGLVFQLFDLGQRQFIGY